MFKDSRAGQILYLFDRVNCDIVSNKILSVSAPRIEASYNQKVGSQPTTNFIAPQPSMVVDITVETKNGPRMYTVRDTNDIGYPDDGVISCDISTILKEVEARKLISEDAIAKVEYHNASIAKCNDLLMQYDPSKKEKIEIDNRFSKIEDSMQNLTNIVTDFINEFKK